MSVAEKKRIMTGMAVRPAKKKLLEIYAKAEPGESFDKKFKGVWPWMETWFRLRSRSETLEAVAVAFAEKVTKLRKQNQALAQIIHDQRKRLAYFEDADRGKAEAPHV